MAFAGAAVTILLFTGPVIDLQLSAVERGAQLEARHLATAVAYGAASSNRSLQRYVEGLDHLYKRDIVIVDAHKSGMADADLCSRMTTMARPIKSSIWNGSRQRSSSMRMPALRERKLLPISLPTPPRAKEVANELDWSLDEFHHCMVDAAAGSLRPGDEELENRDDDSAIWGNDRQEHAARANAPDSSGWPSLAGQNLKFPTDACRAANRFVQRALVICISMRSTLPSKSRNSLMLRRPSGLTRRLEFRTVQYSGAELSTSTRRPTTSIRTVLPSCMS